MKYKIMLNAWTSNRDDYLTVEYDDVLYDTKEEAHAEIDKHSDETLVDYFIVEVE